MIDFKNKNIIVTGADGFLGSHLCGALEQHGASVIRTDINPRQDITHKLDISDAANVDAFVSNLDSSGIEIDGVVNNAAINFRGLYHSDEEFETTMRVNMFGTYNCITKFHKLMEEGSIVNVASIFSTCSPDFRVYNFDPSLYSSVSYGGTKASILQMTRYYSVLYAPKVRVNSISPGGIWQNHSEEFSDKYSDRVPMGRMAQVEEIVQPIMFLLSPLSSYVTGHNLVVDGGLSAW